MLLADDGLIFPAQVRPTNPNRFVIPNGLVGYWGLDPDCLDFTNSLALDLSGNGNAGTLGSFTAAALANGQIGTALTFAAGRSLSLGTVASLQPISAGSFAIWANPSASTSAVLMGFENFATDRNGIGLYQQGLLLVVEVCSASAFNTITNISSSLVTNIWNFCVATWDGSLVKIYLNGVLGISAAQVVSPTNGVYPTSIGSDAASLGGHAFGGPLDDIRIYNRVLGPWEIIALYQAGLAGRR